MGISLSKDGNVSLSKTDPMFPDEPPLDKDTLVD